VRGLSQALRQVRYTNKAFWRNPASAFFTFAFPLMFLVIFTSLLGSGTIEVAPGISIKQSTYYVAAMAAFSVITACYTNIAIILVAITAAFGAAFYKADIPGGAQLLKFLAVLIVGAMSFSALGLAVTAIIPNADASPAVVNALILPLLFLSGVFIPIGASSPEWIKTVGKIFPVKPFAEAMRAGFYGAPFTLSWSDVLVVAVWGLGGLIVASRFFSWEPRK